MAVRCLAMKKQYPCCKKLSIWLFNPQVSSISLNIVGPNIQNPSALFSISSTCFKTHYEVLGVEQNATQKEIKEAYIKKGKELHPDLHQNIEDASSELHEKDRNSTDDWTDQFKAINEAYSVLSKPESKRIYDLSQPGERNRNEDRRKYASYRTYDTFERRAGAAYGYKIDPNYWDSYDRRRGKFKIVIACIIWATFGAILQISVVAWRTDRQSKHMNAQTVMLNQQLLDMKLAAQERGTWEEQREQIRNKEGAEYDRLVALYKADKTAFHRKLEEVSIKEK